MKKIYKTGLLLLIFLETMMFALVFKAIPQVLGFFPEKDIYEQINQKIWEDFIPLKKDIIFMFDNHVLYLIICLTFNIILIFLTRKMFFESVEDWAKKRDLDFWKMLNPGQSKVKGVYELRVEGFISPRNFWIGEGNQESFFEVTLPGCFMGPECSTCVERKKQFKPSHDFEMYLGDRNNWVAKIFTIPDKIDDQTLSQLLGLDVKIIT